MSTTTDITREIKYSRTTRDYDCYVDGQYVGSAANYSAGEALCDQIAFDMIADGACLTATELDGGSDAGLICQYCGQDHADSACPQKRPLLAPRVCGNCGGQHSIQQCSDIRRLLFAA